MLGPDGSYDVELNRFFRELDGWGVRASNSVAAYARDVMLFCRFLHTSRGGKSIWQCDGADLRSYKSVRLHGPGDQLVSVSTWRRSVAALDKWVAWALHEGLLEVAPFRYLDKAVWTPQGRKRMRVNALQEPQGQGAPIRPSTPDPPSRLPPPLPPPSPPTAGTDQPCLAVQANAPASFFPLSDMGPGRASTQHTLTLFGMSVDVRGARRASVLASSSGFGAGFESGGPAGTGGNDFP